MTIDTPAVQDTPSTDRIEKRLVMRAAPSRVWRALSTASEFEQWFRVKLDAAFVEGTTVHGRMTYPGYEHVTVELRIERIEPERYFAYRWHPNALDPAVDYSAEPTTLVEFTLEAAEGGTAVTIVESGFDGIPLARRAAAFRGNERGWDGQLKNLARHVE